jgi:iron complex transport system substrate-binding protein
MGSDEDERVQKDIEEIASVVIDSAYKLHKDLGPGLPETVYEIILTKILIDRGLLVERQVSVPIQYQGIEFNESFQLDILVEKKLIVELKSVETLHPVHPKQLLTYLRLMNLPLGLLLSFGSSLIKDGLKRVVNNHCDFASSRA